MNDKTVLIAGWPVKIETVREWLGLAYKDCPTKYLPLIEDRPLILWLRGQLK